MIKNSFVYILLLSLAISNVFAQSEDEVQDILTKYNNYRFGSIYIYKVKKAKEVEKMRADERAAAEGIVKVDKSVIESLEAKHETGAINLIKQGVNAESPVSGIERDMLRAGFKGFPREDLEQLYNHYKQELEGGSVESRVVVYLVTLPPEKGGKPTDIVGMVISEFPKAKARSMSEMKKQLSRVPKNQVFSAKGMRNKEFKNPAEYNGYKDLYELANAYIRQSNIENVTLEALALEDDFWTGKTVGVSKPLITGNSLNERDIQLFKRISNGDAIDAYGKGYEIELSSDLIRFTKFKEFYTKKKSSSRKNRRSRGRTTEVKDTTAEEEDKGPVPDMTVSNNGSLPKFGVELKYGIDDINMPSLWSERATLSVFWEQAKFGMILPMGDLTASDKDVNLFSHKRKFTSAGVGFAGELDFGFPLIPNSNVFNLSFGYVFGDADESSFNKDRRNFDIENFQGDDFHDYVIRANARLLYTTGIAIDNDYLLRFGVGGAFYNVETWNYQQSTTDDEFDSDKEPTYQKYESESIGNFIVKIDFLTKNTSTPYGVNVNYFDGSLQVNGFVIFPVVNDFLIKVNAKGTSILRDQEHPWEVDGIFQPNINFIYRF